MRIAIYCRVSTSEQARYGLSIDTQLIDLREWANKQGHIVVGEYIERGVSGKKAPSKRPELSRFFDDVERGLQVDLLCFTKLDRFFRSVKLYYQAVSVLDKHHIAWQAIQEDYETVTASGRMKVNIMLAVAENEADRTGERIHTVFEHKVDNGEWLTPRSICVGYSIKDKHLVPNEDAEAVKEAFQYFLDNQSVVLTMDFLKEQYGIALWRQSVRKMLRNRLYIGEYRNNKQFCQPIVPKELFDKVQEQLASRSVRNNQSGKVYIFSGLCRCGTCGGAMVGVSCKKGYKGYRCNNHTSNHKCPSKTTISELKLEAYLLDRVAPELDKLVQQAAVEVQPKKQPPPIDPSVIQAKLDRLKDLYVDGLIDKAQYLADRTKLLDALSRSDNEPSQPDYASLRELLGKDFRTRYGLLNEREQRALWRTLIDHVEISQNRMITFFFKA